MQGNMNIITTTKDLKELVDRLLKEKFVTIDTEFIREYTYYPQLCLIQIAAGSGGNAYAVDPMAKDMDLSPFKKLFKASKVVKVFHSAEQDIEIFYNELKMMPKPIFDTQIAGQVLGYGEAASYATMVQDVCGARLDKSSRFTDWARRPLSDKQLDYALSDVTYLRQLYENFLKRLKEMDREKWIQEDLKDLIDTKHYENDPKEAWKRFKTRHSSPTFMGILKALAKWREETAQKYNIPRNRILRDDGISEIAAEEPITIEELKQMRRIHEKSLQKYGHEIVNVVKKGRRFPVRNMIRQRKPQVMFDSEALFALMRVLLKRQCEKHHVAQKLVATIDEIKELSNMTEKEMRRSKLRLLHGWRNEVFGKYAIKLMSGQLALAVENNQICLLEQQAGQSWD